MLKRLILLFSNLVKKKLPFDPSFYIPDNSNTLQLICHKDSIRYLGVFLDSQLSWRFHIEHIVQKISRAIGIIAKLRHFVPRQTMFNIYKALITPHINFGICIWGNAAKTQLKRVLVLQKRVR